MYHFTPILQALVGLIFTIITALIAPYIKGEINCQRFERIRLLVRIAVRAAEQLFPEEGSGVRKKSYVRRCLKCAGYKLNPQIADALIECAVNTMNHKNYS